MGGGGGKKEGWIGGKKEGRLGQEKERIGGWGKKEKGKNNEGLGKEG